MYLSHLIVCLPHLLFLPQLCSIQSFISTLFYWYYLIIIIIIIVIHFWFIPIIIVIHCAQAYGVVLTLRPNPQDNLITDVGIGTSTGASTSVSSNNSTNISSSSSAGTNPGTDNSTSSSIGTNSSSTLGTNNDASARAIVPPSSDLDNAIKIVYSGDTRPSRSTYPLLIYPLAYLILSPLVHCVFTTCHMTLRPPLSSFTPSTRPPLISHVTPHTSRSPHFS